MNKTLLTIALTSFSFAAFAATANAASTKKTPAPRNDLEIGASLTYASNYIKKGKEHSKSATIVGIDINYSLPPVYSGATQNIYLKGNYISPVTKKYNEANLSIGTDLTFDFIDDTYTLDIGYTYTGYPNNDGGADFITETHQADMNRENEIYLGLKKEVIFFGLEESAVTMGIYGFYNWNIDQFAVEVSATKDFEITSDFSLAPKLFAGHADADKINGDQRHGGAKIGNAYAYYGAELAATYVINDKTDLVAYVGYSYNRDSDHWNNNYRNDEDVAYCGASLVFKY